MQFPDPRNLGFGSLGIGAVAGVAAFLPGPLWLKGILCGLAVLLILVALIILVWHFFIKPRQKRKIGELLNETSGEASSREDRAVLEDKQRMAKKVRQGLKEAREQGCDVAAIPWFLVVGEPATGKTVACKKLTEIGIDTPKGMNAPYKGEGGTLGMDWWFYWDALLIDTAGEDFYKNTPEWKRLLQSLRRERPERPISGMLLFIPADSLMHHDKEIVAERAKRIREQLWSVQKELGVLFPVFIIVSKSDLIPGFRQFFKGLSSEGQHKILGWSRPGRALQGGFSLSEVETGLKTLAQSLKERSLSILSLPWEGYGEEQKNRLLAAAYGFPMAFEETLPNLLSYLKTIFTAGDERQHQHWSSDKAAPAQFFVRGVYFTSSEQKGEPLLRELAREMGKEIKDLDSAIAEKDYKVFFLRDLISEKIFREAGLVTTLPDYFEQLRKWRWIAVSAAVAGLTLFSVACWFGYHHLHESVGSELTAWQASAITPPLCTNRQSSEWWTNTLPYDSKRFRLVQWHDVFSQRLTNRFDAGAFYGVRSASLDNLRKTARRQLFENQVLIPLVSQIRTLVQSHPGTSDPEYWQRHRRAVAGLVWLEAQAAGSADRTRIEQVLTNCYPFVCNSSTSADLSSLLNTCNRIYSTKAASEFWPPNVVIPPDPDSSRMALINQGLDAWLNFQKNNIYELTNTAAACQQYATALQALANLEGLRAQSAQSLKEIRNDLETVSKSIDGAKVKLDAYATNFSTTALSLSLKQTWVLVEKRATETGGKAIELFETSLPPGLGTNNLALIADKLKAAKTAPSPIRDQKPSNLEAIEAAMLVPLGGSNGPPCYQERLLTYQKIARLDPDFGIGTKWSNYVSFLQIRQQFATNAAKYAGGAAPEFQKTCANLFQLLDVLVAARFKADYFEPASSLLSKAATTSELKALNSLLSQISALRADLEHTSQPAQAGIQASIKELKAALSQGEGPLAANLAKALRSTVEPSLGFPIIVDAAKALEPDKVIEVYGVLTNGQSTHALIKASHPFVTNYVAFVQLEKELSNLARIAYQLSLTNKAGISVQTGRLIYDYIRPEQMPADIATPALYNNQSNFLGNLPIHGPLSFCCWNDPSSSNRAHIATNWGPIALFLNPSVEVKTPKGVATNLFMRVSLPEGFPATREKWPRSDAWNPQ